MSNNVFVVGKIWHLKRLQPNRPVNAVNTELDSVHWGMWVIERHRSASLTGRPTNVEGLPLWPIAWDCRHYANSIQLRMREVLVRSQVWDQPCTWYWMHTHQTFTKYRPGTKGLWICWMVSNSDLTGDLPWNLQRWVLFFLSVDWVCETTCGNLWLIFLSWVKKFQRTNASKHSLCHDGSSCRRKLKCDQC